jgi:hypothetical protein
MQKPRAIQGTGLFHSYDGQTVAPSARRLRLAHSERCGFTLSTFEYSLLSAEI